MIMEKRLKSKNSGHNLEIDPATLNVSDIMKETFLNAVKYF